MILKSDHSTQYLTDYIDGKISKGLDTGIGALDDHLRYKKGQLNMINGLDNVGKTAWILWYFLRLSMRHNLSWCIWSGENNPAQLVRQLIEFYTGKKIKELQPAKVYLYEQEIGVWFKFIDNSRSYDNKDLYKLFSDSGCTGALIDPFTGLKRGYTHADNYMFLNESREFVNSTKITLYVNSHPHTEAARRKHTNGEFEGYIMPPMRSETEGGQPFANRVDDFITIHRYVGHPTQGYKTLIYTRKIKDTETGGKVCDINDPIVFDWNGGRGFETTSEPIRELRDYTQSQIIEDAPF